MSGSPCPCRGCTTAYKQGREDGKATVHDCGQHSMSCCTAGYERGYREGYTDGFNEAQAANKLLNEMYGVKQDEDSIHH